jgi:Phage late control gene D protein (GPD).
MKNAAMSVTTEDLLTADINGFSIVIDGESPQDVDELEFGLRVETDAHNRAGIAEATVLGEIAQEETIAVTINDERVFTGTVRSTEQGVGDRLRVTAYDALYDLKNETTSGDFEDIPAGQLLERELGDTVTLVNRVSQGQAGPGRVPGPANAPLLLSPTFDNVRLDELLETVAQLADLAYYVTAENKLVVARPDTVGKSVVASRLRDASPGKSTPPYQQVEVIGSVTDSNGDLVSSSPLVATAGQGQPVFTYRDRQIKTFTQAQNTANQIKRRLEQQQQNGFIELLGRPDIDPFDAVQLPETFGGEVYLVSEIKHTVTADNGFLTRLGLGGLLSA